MFKKEKKILTLIPPESFLCLHLDRYVGREFLENKSKVCSNKENMMTSCCRGGSSRGGGSLGSGPPSPLWGTPQLHKEGKKNVACVCVNVPRFST